MSAPLSSVNCSERTYKFESSPDITGVPEIKTLTSEPAFAASKVATKPVISTLCPASAFVITSIIVAFVVES